MKTTKDIVLNQIALVKQIQAIGINLVTCGNCGTTLLHETKNETIKCVCGYEMEDCDCPDIWYEGMEYEHLLIKDKYENTNAN